MTKKDYIKIAAVIKGARHYDVNADEMLSEVASNLATMFYQDNDRFDQDRFLKACDL